MALCSLEYGIRWHWTNIIFKEFSEIESATDCCPIVYEALAAIFGRKELLYNNVMWLCYFIFGVNCQ